jgi:hypothetical protein
MIFRIELKTMCYEIPFTYFLYILIWVLKNFNYICSSYVIFFYCGAGTQTQGLTHARHTFDHLATNSHFFYWTL